MKTVLTYSIVGHIIVDDKLDGRCQFAIDKSLAGMGEAITEWVESTKRTYDSLQLVDNDKISFDTSVDHTLNIVKDWDGKF